MTGLVTAEDSVAVARHGDKHVTEIETESLLAHDEVGFSTRPRIRVGLPVPKPDGDRIRLDPWVELADPIPFEATVSSPSDRGYWPLHVQEPPEPGIRVARSLPSSHSPPDAYDSSVGSLDGDVVGPVFLDENENLVPSNSLFSELANLGTDVVQEEALAPMFEQAVADPATPWDRVRGWWGQPLGHFAGIGYQRLPFALFEMDTAVPTKLMRLRLAAAYQHQFPDRAEYFWAKAPNGRGLSNANVESSVDYQDLRLQLETGGELASVITELALRSLDPEFNPNTTGLGDMNVAIKTVLKDGDNWTLSQIFRTYMNTGSITHGLSTGHVSLEPGLLYTRRHGRRLQFHGELKYWFPIAGDPAHSGQVLRYGLGVSRVLRETDCWAIIPTLEGVAFTFLDGRRTTPDSLGLPQPLEIDGETVLNLYPGLWFVHDGKTLIELGLSGGFAISDNAMYDSLLRADLRIAF